MSPVSAYALDSSEWRTGRVIPRARKPAGLFKHVNSMSQIIALVVMMYVRFRSFDDVLAERGMDPCHETVRHCWNQGSLDPHLTDRQTGKAARSAALAERAESYGLDHP
jgi:hypothetical protein